MRVGEGPADRNKGMSRGGRRKAPRAGRRRAGGGSRRRSRRVRTFRIWLAMIATSADGGKTSASTPDTQSCIGGCSGVVRGKKRPPAKFSLRSTIAVGKAAMRERAPARQARIRRRCSTRSGVSCVHRARKRRRHLAIPARHVNERPAPHAALRFGWMSLRLTSTSAICTAFSAAPLRRLSETTHMDSPFSTVGSSRMRLM